ncbi:MAG: DegV family protein [Fidelibacterota bacterium]
MAIQYLDGIRLHRTFQAGLHRVLAREAYLNKINVFPVPDGDTGTNLAYTLMAIKKRLKQEVSPDLSVMSSTLATAALDGARGNSGVILAQFLVGFAKGVNDQNQLDTNGFAAAMDTARTFAYEALVQPQEGTILTVISQWVKTLQTAGDSLMDFKTLLQEALESAQQALLETPKKLGVLARAGVVDAGGQGFVDLLRGIQDYIHEGKTQPVTITSPERKQLPEMTPSGERHQFCMECVVTGDAINRREIQHALANLGNSIVVAGLANKVRVHIHTDEPRAVLNICQQYGTVSNEKADDMYRQAKDARRASRDIAVVVDSGCDLPEAVLERLNIHVIPVRLNFGSQHYIDKMTITGDEFWQELATNPVHPQTSQPPPGDFLRQYQFLASHYRCAVSIHLPESVSGTCQSARMALRSLDNFTASVVDSQNVSIGMGLVAIRAAEAAQAGKKFAEVVTITKEAVKQTKLYISLDTLSYLVKGGRISNSKQRVAEFFRIHPILTVTEHGVKTIKHLWGRKKKHEKFVQFVLKRIPKDKKVRIGVGHSRCLDRAQKVASIMESLVGKENVFLAEVGPALGVHAGPKAIAIAVQTMEEESS